MRTILVISLCLAPWSVSAQTIVTNDAELRAAILAATAGTTIQLGADITLLGDLPAIAQNITFDGAGHTLSGNNLYRGLMVANLSGGGAIPSAVAVTIQNVSITNTVATGGTGGAGAQGGGGGGGLGGGLFVAASANVTLSNVSITNSQAIGGNGGAGGVPGAGNGGGGGLGGNGGAGGFFGSAPYDGGGGGAGVGASGGSNSAGAAGILTGGAAGGAAAGGPVQPGGTAGGGGGSNLTGAGGGGAGGAGGAGGDGGYGGGGAGSAASGGAGGVGGGGGAGTLGTGGYGGGGGGTFFTFSNAGGFAGGASGNSPTAGGGGGGGLGGGIFVEGGGTLNITGGLTVNGNAVAAGNGGAGGAAGSSGLSGGSGIFFGGSGIINFAPTAGVSQGVGDVIADEAGTGGSLSVALGKAGAGTLTLSGQNTYTGGTVISGGTLSVSSSGNLGSSSSAITIDGGTLATTATNTFTQVVLLGAGTVSASAGTVATFSTQFGDSAGAGPSGGQLTVTGGGTVVLTSPDNSYTGGTTIVGNSTVLVASDAGLGDAAGGVTLGDAGSRGTLGFLTGQSGTAGRNISIGSGGGVIDTQGTADMRVSGNVTSSGGLTKTGTGTLTLGGSNTYSGGTVVNAGTLVAGGIDVFGTGSMQIDTGATLNLADNNQTFGSLAGAGTVVMGNGTVTAGGNNTSTTFSGVLSGTGGLVKNGTGTMTLTGANFYTGDTTINGGTLAGDTTSLQGNILDNAVLQFNQAAAGTFAGTVSGTGSLTKTGAGTLTLTGANSYSGGTLISAGTLAGDTTSLQGNIQDNAALLFNQAANGLFTGAISGTGSVTKNGAGTLVLNGANTYTGGTTVNAGVLYGDATSLQGAIVNNTTVVFDQAGAGTYAGTMSGSGSLLKFGTGTLSLNGANTYSGGTLISSGTLIGSSTSLQGDIQNDAALVFNQATNGTYAGTMAGSGSLTKTGAGTLTLTGANAYTGGTTISAGTLAGDTTSLQGNIQDDAVLQFNQAAAGTFAGTISGSGSLTKTGAGTLTLTGANTYTGGTTVNGGTLYGNTTNLQGAITNNAAVVFDQAAAGTYAGNMDGSGSLVKSGAGTLTLGGTNAYTGGTLVAGGTLIGSATSLQGDIQNDAQVIFNQTADGTYAGNMAGTGSLTKSGAGTLTLTGATGYSGGTFITAGTLEGNSANLQGSISNLGQLRFNQALDGTFTGSIGGTGSVTKTGAGMLVLNGANAYTGGTTVSGGSLVGDVTSLQGDILNDATLVFNQLSDATFTGNLSGSGVLVKAGGATLTLGGSNTQTGGTVIQGGALVANTANLFGPVLDNGSLVFNQNAAGVFGGSIVGSGSLTKSGAGTLTLTGFNSYGGGTFITGGTLAGSTQSLQGSIANGGQLVFAQSFDGIFNGSIGGIGSVVKDGAGTLFLNGANTYTGGTTLNAGGLFGTTSSLQGAILNNGVVTFSQNADGTYAGNMSGSGSLVKAGTGTLTLSGTNLFTGGTVVSGGAISLAQDAALGAAAGGVSLGDALSSATMTFTNGVQLSSLRGFTLAAGGGIFNTTGAQVTLSGDISGAGGLTKTGAGVLELARSNSYTGPTVVTDGTLRAGAAGAFGNGGTLVVNAGGAVDLNGFAQSVGSLSGSGSFSLGSGTLTAGVGNASSAFAGALSGSGSLIKAGSGTLFLTGSNTYSGGTTVLGGLLAGTTSSVQGNIVNNGVVLFDQNAAGTYSGSMSGSGSLFKSGSGLLTLTGSNTYSGGTVIAGGGIFASASSLSGAIVNDGMLGFGGASNGVFNGIIGGAGTLTKSGTGTVTMNGPQALTGLTTVAQGTLALNGGIAGSVDVASGATLRVNGFIGGSLSVGGSLFAVPPGGAVSTPSMQSTNAGGTALDSAPYLGVGGNFTALNGSRVSFEVGPGTNPTILVGGSANINGAQFDVTAPAIGNQRATTFLALAALNGLTFANAGIAVDQANVEPILKQTQNSLFVTLLNLNVPLSIDGGAGNRPVADAIDRTKFGATGDARTVVRELTALDAAGLKDALEQLGGELHASVLHTAILDAESMADVVRDQLAWREMEGGNDFQWWADTACQRADFEGTNNARGGQANVCTGAGGGDRRFSEKWTVGFGGSWTDGSMGLGDLGKGDYTAPRAFGYAGFKPKTFGVRFGGSGAKSNYDTRRQIQFQAFLPPELGGVPLDLGIDRKAEAEQKGNTSDQWSEIHDSRKIKTYTIEGLFGMRHARISRASFIESGALSISLDGEDEILDLTQTDAKVKFWRREGTYRPFGDFSYRRELAEDGTQAAVRFDGLPQSDFIVQGINIPTSTYSIRGGMNIMFPFGQATMTYEYKRAEGQKRQTLGFRMRFK